MVFVGKVSSDLLEWTVCLRLRSDVFFGMGEKGLKFCFGIPRGLWYEVVRLSVCVQGLLADVVGGRLGIELMCKCVYHDYMLLESEY